MNVDVQMAWRNLYMVGGTWLFAGLLYIFGARYVPRFVWMLGVGLIALLIHVVTAFVPYYFMKNPAPNAWADAGRIISGIIGIGWVVYFICYREELINGSKILTKNSRSHK
jgi:hypothetical protein